MKLIKTLGVIGILYFYLWLAGSWLSMPVHEWCEEEYSDNGSVYTIYHCSSPTYWDKITNSEDWQEWEKWERNNQLPRKPLLGEFE